MAGVPIGADWDPSPNGIPIPFQSVKIFCGGVPLGWRFTALKRHGQTAEIVTDGLRPYPAALKELNPGLRRRSGRWANNRRKTATCPSDDEKRRCGVSGA
jgi:hypothetical protein